MTEVIGSDQEYTKAERAAMARLMAAMIPADEARGLLSAADEQIVSKALLLLVPYKSPVQALIAELAGTDESMLALLDETMPAGQLVKSAVIQAYYQDERIVSAIGMGEGPPFPRGNETPEGDWSLLDNVRKKGKLYREV